MVSNVLTDWNKLVPFLLKIFDEKELIAKENIFSRSIQAQKV